MNNKKGPQLTLTYPASSKKEEIRKNRETGIIIIGAVPWGTHLCQFYKTKEDLIDILVPYFKTGLNNNELCMWITSEPLQVIEAKRALKKAVKNLDNYIKKGQIEILDSTEWYTKSGKFDADAVLSGWVKKEEWARNHGFDGLRLSGNTFWLEKKDWDDFTKYEEIINHVIGKYNMLAICSYSLDKCNASEIIDVVSNHQFALIKRERKWHRIESSELKKSEKEREQQKQLLNHVQDGIIVSDPDFRINYWNKGAEQIFGYNKAEALGKTTQELLRPTYAPGEREKIIHELNRNGTSKVRIRTKHRNGTKIVAEVYSTRITDNSGNISGYVVSYRDITDRMNAEEELHETRDYLENLLNYANAPIIVWDKKFKIMRFNHAFEHLTGYTSERIIGKKLDILFPKENKEESVQKIQRTLSGEYWESVEIPILRKDGNIRIVLWNSANIYNKEKNLIATIAQGIDITERKQFEDMLKESENRLNKAQELSHLGSWELNLINNHLTWSDEVYRIFGLKPQEFNATYDAFLEAIHPDDRAAVDAAYSESLREGRDTYEIEHRIVRKNGEIRFVHEKCNHIRDNFGKIIRSIGMVQDLTEQKQIDEKIKYLASYPQLNPSPVLEVDQSGTIIYQNPAAQQLFPDITKLSTRHPLLIDWKHVIKELKGGNWSKTVIREVAIDQSYYQQIIAAYEKNKIRLYNFNITDRKKIEIALNESEEKYRRIVENTTNVIMVTKPDGIISYLSPSCKDVLGYDPKDLVDSSPIIFHPDDVQKVQQSLYRALKGEKGSGFEYRIITKQGNTKWISHAWAPIMINNKLQSIVSVIEDITQRKKIEDDIQNLNQNLIHQANELAASNKELEAFSYSVSHDLRAPLRSIDGFSQALLEDYTEHLDEQGKDYIQRVRKAARRMEQLIDDMLRLSRLIRAEMTIQEVDLGKTAASIIEGFKKAEPTRKVKFITYNNLVAHGDINLLNILLENLLGNAWKFTKKCKQAEIEFGKKQQGKETVFYIRDNGAGFNMKYVNKLFIPFQRLHDDADYPGTGIGLGIVSRVIHRHGGRIWAEAEEGKGATFYFTLGGKTNE